MFASCDRDRAVSCEQDQQHTWSMRYEWDRAWDYNLGCQERAENDFDRCLTSEDVSRDCAEEVNLENQWCVYWFARQINKVPLRVCGVSVYNIIGDPSTQDWRLEPNDNDDDGDGVSNYWEFYLGMNPCSQYSYGCDGGQDGTNDFDADGVLDRDDSAPRCNTGYDPGDGISDCV